MAIESFYDGGAEMFAIRLANEITQYANVAFVELYSYRSKGKHQKKLLNKSITVIHLGSNPFAFLLHSFSKKNFLLKKLFSLYNFYKQKKIISVLKKHKIDIVHSHSWESDLYFSAIRNHIQFQFVSTFHGHYELMKKHGGFFERNARLILSKIDKVVYLSHEQESSLDRFEFPKEKRRKIFHGVDLNVTQGKSEYKTGNNLKCIMIGRGIREKGWEEVIKAVLLLEKKYQKKIQLHLVGEGPFLDDLRSDYQIDNIYFLGYQDDVISLINQADVCLLSSYSEHLPLVVIEYLTCGKPVIATDTGAIKEMITYNNEQAGIIIPVKENSAPDPASIAEAIETYINKPELISKHSGIAIKAAQKFRMESCTNAYLSLYDSLVKNEEVSVPEPKLMLVNE